ncbi:hypothetical protein BVRB_4g080330 [Beta vulgaris subsp. vulgaris]|nr:hypothetical protein BVRB_4g080330 [Beta vulgaris subsp. vulgaris]
MGDYNITYDKAAPLKAKVVDKYKVVKELIPDYFGSDDVIGLDIKKFPRTGYTTKPEILVICGSSRCLIIQLSLIGLDSIFGAYTSTSNSSLEKFLTNSDICFVRPFNFNLSKSQSVAVCELAARVLKKPKLMKESSLEVVARQVGVPYKDVYGSSVRDSKDGSIMVNDDDGVVLTQEQVEKVAYDAFTCRTIASKLLSSLK